MEQGNFNKDGQETTTVTRTLLGVGIGVLLAFVVVAFVWFGLVNPSSPSQNPTNVAVAITATPSAKPTSLTTVTPTSTALATVTASVETTALASSTAFDTFTAATPTVLATVNPASVATAVNIFPFFPTATPIMAATEYPYTTSVPSFDTVTPTIDFSNSPTVDSFATALASSSTTAVVTASGITPAVMVSPTAEDIVTASPTLAATTTPNSSDWPATAATAFDQLQTLHFIIDIRGGKVQIMPETDLKHAEGDLSHSTGDFQAKIAAHIFVGDITVQTVRVNGEQYLTNPIDGQWAKLSPDETFDLSVLFDPKSGIGALNRQLQNVTMLPDATIDNVDCVHFSATLPGSAVGPISYNTLGKNPVTLEEWVGKDDKLIRQIYLKETTNNGAFWVINLSKFNESLNIQKPNV